MNEVEIYVAKETYKVICEFINKRIQFGLPLLTDMQRESPILVIIPIEE